VGRHQGRNEPYQYQGQGRERSSSRTPLDAYRAVACRSNWQSAPGCIDWPQLGAGPAGRWRSGRGDQYFELALESAAREGRGVGRDVGLEHAFDREHMRAQPLVLVVVAVAAQPTAIQLDRVVAV